MPAPKQGSPSPDRPKCTYNYVAFGRSFGMPFHTKRMHKIGQVLYKYPPVCSLEGSKVVLRTSLGRAGLVIKLQRVAQDESGPCVCMESVQTVYCINTLRARAKSLITWELERMFHYWALDRSDLLHKRGYTWYCRVPYSRALPYTHHVYGPRVPSADRAVCMHHGTAHVVPCGL